MLAPDFWIIAGPNGAGKTTLVSQGGFAGIVPLGSTINPDDITLKYLRTEGISTWAEAPLEMQKKMFIQAAEAAQRMLENRIEECGVAVVESVLSTRKYCPLVERTLAMSGRFFLIYIMLESPALSQRRVAARFDRGGHNVPIDKLNKRWENSLNILPWFAARATKFWIIDNSNDENGIEPRLIISGENRRLKVNEVLSANVRAIISKIVSAVIAEGENWVLEIEGS